MRCLLGAQAVGDPLIPIRRRFGTAAGSADPFHPADRGTAATATSPPQQPPPPPVEPPAQRPRSGGAPAVAAPAAVVAAY